MTRALLFLTLLARAIATDTMAPPAGDDASFADMGDMTDTYGWKPEHAKEHGADLEEEMELEKELAGLVSGPVQEEAKNKSALDGDVISHIHTVPIQEEESMVGGYIFDVDDTNRNPTQRCYVRNQGADKTKMPDNIENSIVDAQEQLNDDGTNRAQWAKCLPPPMYTLLSVESFAEGDIYDGRYEKRMRNATDFYAMLKWLHNEACSHLRLRLESEVMLADIREEVNYRSKLGVGYKIKAALQPIIEHIVSQYRSWNPRVNAANAKTVDLLKNAVPALKQALRVAKHSSMVTLENGEGRRRNTATKSAKEMLEPLYNSVMKFDLNSMTEFINARPGPLEDMMTGDGKRGLGNPVVGSDGLPDALKNYGRCGKPLFDFAGYVLYTLTISHDKEKRVTILTKDGWLLPEQLIQKTQDIPLRMLLPPDAYEVETKTTAYQDDLFAQGNLACGNRADGLWTLTSYDRNSNTNQVTATQEEGYFCIWMLNDLLVLPENQRAGFSNTEFIAESPTEMARVMNGDENNYKRYFPKPGEKYKYYHCHYAPRNSGSARVHSFQHQAERHYPGGIRQYCNCDWRRMGMLVSRCDCTLDAKANGGCRRVEMDMLNEHTQVDLWRKDGKKDVPSRAVMMHGALAEGKITSYTYQNNRRRRQPDNKNIFQEDTSRVRPTTDGNGGNNVVCSVNAEGVPDTQSRAFKRGDNLQAKSTVDPTKDPNCKTRAGLHEEVFYFNQGTSLQNLAGRTYSTSRVVTNINYGSQSNTRTWSGFRTNQNFAVRWWGKLNIRNRGYYYFYMSQDDGARMYLNNQIYINNNYYNRWYSRNSRPFLEAKDYDFRIEYYQRSGSSGMLFQIQDQNRRQLSINSMFTANCGSPNTGGSTLDRSFFTDLNQNGVMDYPECRRRRTSNQAHRRRGASSCSDAGKEFPLRDIYSGAQSSGRRRTASGTSSSPAGGINHEFIDSDGKACDALNMKKTCKPADAGKMQEGYLVRFLAKFCDIPSALYKVPVNSSGVVPEEFGALTYPMPIHGYGGKWTNYRAYARAEFGAMKHGTWLFCQSNSKKAPGIGPVAAPGREQCIGKEGNEPLAVQGEFNGIKDETVWSAKDSANVLKSKFYPTVGGSKYGKVPSAVPAKWTQAGTAESGLFNNDVLTKFRTSTNAGAQYATERVWMDSTRGEGVTCLNGKYVYARKMKDGSRPVVSTVREAFNRNGPVASGQWACRYLGTACNANNCNNNGNGEVPGPFVAPKIRAKRVKPTKAPTPAPTPAPTKAPPPPSRSPISRRRRRKAAPSPPAPSGPTPAPVASRRRRRKAPAAPAPPGATRRRKGAPSPPAPPGALRRRRKR